MLTWIIVGSVWLFTDYECYDDFYSLWAMTLAVLIVCYITLGFFVCLCFCICVFGASIGIGAALKFKKQQKR